MLVASAIAVPAAAQTKAPDGGPYVPTPYLIAERMLALANVGPDDYVIDLGSGDGRRATVVTTYLLPQIMGEVEAKLRRELKPGTRVVCHDYPLPTWTPVDVVTFESPDKVAISGAARTVLYLYRVPEKR